MPAALPVDWTAIKEAMIAGVPAIELARRHNLTDSEGRPDTTAIRKRCSREKWPVPASIMDRASKKLADARQEVQETAKALSLTGQAVTVSQESREIGSDELLKYWKRTQMALLPPLTEQAELAVTENPEFFRPSNLKEMTQLVGITGKLTGADRPQQAVQVNLWTQGSGAHQTGDSP